MKFLYTLIPALMQSFGLDLKNKDANNTGSDDRAGDMLIAGSQVVSVYLNGQQQGNAYYKAVQAIRDAADAILKERPPVV